MRLAASLHGFQIGISNRGNLTVLIHFHTFGLWRDIFIQCINIVNAFTKLTALLVVEDIEHKFIRHTGTQTLVSGTQFIRKLFTKVLP